MKNSETPYACAICKKEFHNSIPLVKHFELRHQSSHQKSTNSNKNVGIDLESNSQSDSSSIISILYEIDINLY